MMHRRPDSYHTCYTLTGVSNVEHSHTYGPVEVSEPFASAFTWEASKAQIPSESNPTVTFDTGADVRAMNPVYAIPHTAALSIRAWAVSQPLNLEQK